MNLSKTYLFSTILAATAATAGVIDDAKFKLDLRGDPNANAYIDAGEVGNAFDFSAASPVSAVYGGGNGQSSISAVQYASQGTAKYGTLPYVTGVSVTNPYDGLASSRPCLVLPQETKTENSKTYWAENGIRIPNAAVQPGNDGYVTIYSRFKWDGNTSSPNLLVGNGWNQYNDCNGQSVYLDGEGKIGVLVSNNMSSVATKAIKLSKNVWNDVFVTTHNEIVGGVEKAVSEISICQASSSAPSISNISITNNNAMYFSANVVSIGCYLLNSTGWHVLSGNNPRAFRGTIADVMIWDRALTDDEKIMVMAGVPCGGEWQIGAVNNSADEFGDSNPAEVFEPQTMPWSFMRKTLDASNPTLSIAATMTSAEHQMARTLTFTPILSGGSAPVEVVLNGTAVGEIDLALETSITLPKELWRHDGTANTITVTRGSSASGTIRFDAISLAPAPTATSILDDASFKLDLRGGESTFTMPGDLGNAFAFSSASPVVGYMGDQRGPQTYNANFGNLPAQESVDVPNPYYPYTTNTQNVLHFYQDEKSATASALTGVVFPGAAPQGPVQTFYLRFRWDGRVPGSAYTPSYIFQSGNAENAWKEAGVALYVNENSNSSITNLGFRGALITGDFVNLQLSAGEWCDAFVTFAQNADNTKYTATATLCKPNPNGANFSPPTLVTQSRTMDRSLSFNSRNLTIGGYYNSSTSASSTRAFRGLIAEFMVWDRALTDDEKIEVMAGQHGAKWRVGAINGSADEFTDTDPAAVFEPQSMPWRQMRKTLDASHPTLTLKSPLATFEAGKAMILHIDPLFTGTPAAVPVTVSVNGNAVGSFDLAEKRNFIIEKQKWQRDGSGNVTVALTRTDTTGSVAIDAITLSGSWQLQNETGNKMLNEAYAPNHYFAGDPIASHMGDSFSRGKSHVAYNFGVWVPSGLEDGYSWKFFAKTTTIYASVLPEDRSFTLSVNGALQTTVEGLAAGGTYSIDIPEGVLHPGMNMVEFRQTAPTTGTDWSYYGPWGMSLVPPANPFVLIMR